MPHGGHYCALGIGSDSMLPKSNKCLGLFRRWRKLCQVSEHHPQSYQHFYSYAGVVAERQRHYSEGNGCIIHPFSLISLSWNTFMAVVNLAHMVASSLRAGYIIDIHYREPHQLDHIIFILNLCCQSDMFVRFHTGYVDSRAHIVFDKRAITFRYLRFWFWLDLLSCFPFSYIFLHQDEHLSLYMYISCVLSILRTARLGDTMNNIKTLMELFGASYVCYASVHTSILFILSVHWCCCLIGFSPISSYYLKNQIFSLDFRDFLITTKNLSHSLGLRYSKGLYISLSSFFGTGFTLYIRYEPDEVIIHSIIIMYAALFMIYVLVFLIKVYILKYDSLVRYHELMGQVKDYMRHRQFPTELKKRIIAFYQYKYCGTYYREDLVMESLSEQLRSEITLHSCHKLVNKVALFDGMPASVVGSVLGCLHPEVFLPDDLVVRAGDVGECMYFIASGTVAVYSLKGVEVCHLEDGGHFGEVALLMKDSKRIATVVAVEITQVYRLDVTDFRRSITTYPELYDRIDKIAFKRMHQTVLLDEAFRRERERLNEMLQLGSMQDGGSVH